MFRFKQFTVKNELSAMKVGTDGVLLGAWADVAHSKHILDVGTGTGLIALMVAQRSFAAIDAIEIDSDAACEARENFINSPWAERLSVINGDFADSGTLAGRVYDTIISNPPYFVNSLNCPDEQRNKARHTSTLSYNVLIANIANLLATDGNVFLITPSDVEDLLTGIIADNNLFVCGKTYVLPTPNALPKRILWHISNSQKNYRQNTITIEVSRHVYTEDYIAMTKDYYINM